MKIFTIGPRPPKESIGSPEKYIEAIRAKLGIEVGSAKLKTLGKNVICTYDSDDPVGEDYAKTIKELGPQDWHDVERHPIADHLGASELVAGWYG